MRVPRPFLIAVIVLGAIHCGPGPISDSIGSAVSRGPGTRLALTEHVTFVWDKICILGPYTTDDEVEAITGIQGAAARAYDIRSNDGINVLMFIDGSRVAGSVAHPRDLGDFGPEQSRRYSWSEHHLKVAGEISGLDSASG
jgi:hypothetical protein